MGWVHNASPEVEAASQYPLILGINYAGRPFYQLGIAGFKASLCLSYLRLISGTSKRHYRIVIWIVIAASTLGHLAGALSLLFNCTPVGRASTRAARDHTLTTIRPQQIRKSWNIRVPGKCLPVGGLFYGLAIYTIITDVIIIVLPIPLLLGLNIKLAQKAGVVCLFLLGLFTTVCSIMRLTQIQRVAFGDGNSTMLVLWGTIEFNVGNIVTCIPYLAPLLKGFVRGIASSGDKSKQFYYDSQGRSYLMDNWSKDPQSHMQSTASGHKKPKRTPSEELILATQEPEHGGIEKTVEYRVSSEGTAPK
ncbi:hypothetical protein PEX1_067790 [Penicillium expansum]|uniref:Rhodopsin domain-containing protein n=1 Tax=Penicillium expansum TaxID=27334 RepID=A0A0A2K8G7_PENEN|nr:hypothetical protein PEX2_088420 [Penicillium expansum]KGO42423.1 hypothetical protein PEXP_053700 [Penicillium expansum]KGO60660.1 hypothetical protein PEX2_088420 [Penicillium expansum]KGO69986.1 hypothetical protein PEX1_067790 [Penicillium expansum]